MNRYRDVEPVFPRFLNRLALLLALLAFGASLAHAFSLDARRMAMGGAAPPRSDRLQADNPAYTIVPERFDSRGFQIPIPLGLIQLMSDPPVFDTEDEEFDPIKLLNLVANFPWHLDLKEPADLNGDVYIELSADSLIIFWEDAVLFVPEKPFDLGFRWDRWSIPLLRGSREDLRWRLSVNPYADASARAELDDNLYGLLAEGLPLKANSSYGTDMDALAMAGLAWQLLFAKRIGLDAGRSIYLAAAPKLITGFAMSDYDARFLTTTGSTDIASETLDLEFESFSRTSDGFDVAYGLSWDLGVALRSGPLDLGFGVRDLAGKVKFKKTSLVHGVLEEVADPDNPGSTTSEVVKTKLEEGVEHEYEIEPYYTVNASFDWRGWLFLGETKIRPHRSSLHLGAERWFGAFAIRGGAQQDAESSWQYSGGAGFLLDSGFEINVGLETHDRYIQDESGIALGLSINI